MSDTKPRSLPTFAMLGFGAYMLTEVLYMPLILKRMSVTLSLPVAPFLIWSICRGSRAAAYATSAMLLMALIIFDVPLLLFALGGSKIGVTGSIVLSIHAVVSIVMAGYLIFSKAMKEFTESKRENPFGS